MTPSGDALGSGHFCYVAKRFFVKIKESYYFNRFNVTGTNVFRSNVARSTDVVPIGLPMKFLLILMRFRQSIKRDCASIHLYLCISRHLKYFKYYSQGIVVFQVSNAHIDSKLLADYYLQGSLESRIVLHVIHYLIISSNGVVYDVGERIMTQEKAQLTNSCVGKMKIYAEISTHETTVVF